MPKKADGDGNRVEKSNGSTGTLYWYMTPGIVAESDLKGNLQSEYVFFDGERVARKDFPSNAVSYYFSDHLKTTDIVTDPAGNIRSESDYYPWGGELPYLANDSNHYKFTSKERDSETQLDYFGARYYSNGLGRFITPDWAAKATAVPYAEFADPQSLNLYSYVRNVPTTRFDADGHCEPFCFLVPIVSQRIADDVMKSGGGKAAAKDAGIGAAKAVGSMELHGLLQSSPAGAIVDHFIGEPKALQASNQTQSDAKIGTQVTVTVVGAVVSGKIAGIAGAGSSVESSAANGGKSVPESIPAGPSARPTAEQQAAINEIGEAHGCHTCGATSPGTQSGNWVGDHQPPTALNPPGNPQVYKPQCLSCSRAQGGIVRAQKAAQEAAQNNQPQ